MDIWLCIVSVYFVGAVVSYCMVVGDDGSRLKEEYAGTVGLLWPVFILLGIIYEIKRLMDKIFGDEGGMIE